MRRMIGALPAALLLAAAAADNAAHAPPRDERLRYAISWPSGLPVGQAEFRAREVDPGWRFEMTLRASLPNFEIDDAFVSRADPRMCSQRFEKHVRHGKRRAHESLRFGDGAVERANLDAGGREPPGVTPAGPCARDALAFLYFLREDLAAGRITPPGEIFFGAGYRVELEFARTRRLRVGEEARLADEIRAVVRGAASEHAFSIFFARDEARTPLLFRVDLEDGPFAMTLLE